MDQALAKMLAAADTFTADPQALFALLFLAAIVGFVCFLAALARHMPEPVEIDDETSDPQPTAD